MTILKFQISVSINEFTYDISKVLTSGSINSARVLGFGGFALSYKIGVWYKTGGR
jgi:hypothetical protein